MHSGRSYSVDKDEGDKVKGRFRDRQGPCSTRREVLGERPGDSGHWGVGGMPKASFQSMVFVE